MKIGIIGYGKMGRAIEEVAQANNHEIALKINSKNTSELDNLPKYELDVAIEFSNPNAAFSNITKLLSAGVPTVSGTTAWLEHYDQIKKLCHAQKGAFLYASNFSIGVNILFAINKKLSSLMNDHPQYQPSITEIHHTQKLDAPSGTAITLAEGILSSIPRILSWTDQESRQINTLGIVSHRQDPAPGTHIINYTSVEDTISLRHEAHSRKGFAKGALLAAEWLQGKEGVYAMDDVLGL